MKSLLKQYWGYTDFRPFQLETINAILEGQDSLTVLPTGGGKSLCFQIPALHQEGLAVVISPLISLMKDQVDGLKEMGVLAASLNSSMTDVEQSGVIEQIKNRTLKLLYIAPERLQTEAIIRLLQSVPLSFFVIDEAHCVSEWGHDFRDDYLKLNSIKEDFSGIPIHAFTATATPKVREDIVRLLQLTEPLCNIAPIDRPNLTYRVKGRANFQSQIQKVLESHKGEPGIIYCIRRKDVDSLSEELNVIGIRNLPYHAGLSDHDRHRHQEAFAQEKVDLIVATVAFGMGIDRSNIRFVIHAGMPKSLEHYQQETGRAGRDGLPSSCYLFYSGADFRTWSFLLGGSPHSRVMLDKLQSLYRFCSEPDCRHKGLVKYFGQTPKAGSCQACDFCLGEIEQLENPILWGQKVLSCVARVKERFGADHIARVLKGLDSDNITRWKHDQLSTFGLIPDQPIRFIRSLIEQLVGQGFLKREAEFSTLSVTELGRQLLKGEATPALAKPFLPAKKERALKKMRSHAKELNWDEVDQSLFEKLRAKRSELATEKGVPAFVIFGDKSLIDMAQAKPQSLKEFAKIYGVGDRKLKQYGSVFLEVIQAI